MSETEKNGVAAKEPRAAVKELLLKFGIGAGSAGAGAGIVTLLVLNPGLAGKILANWPGAVFGIVCMGFFLIDRRAGQGIKALTLMAEANKALATSVNGIGESLAVVAQSTGSELESIKASLGSLHGKVDEMRVRQT